MGLVFIRFPVHTSGHHELGWARKMSDRDNNKNIENTGTKSKPKKVHSLRMRITLVYMALAILNIIFFSALIFENQTDLLLENFQFHSHNLVRTVLDDLDKSLQSQENPDLDRLTTTLKTRGVSKFLILDKNAAVVKRVPESENGNVAESLKRRVIEMATTSTLFRSRYNLELNEENFSVDFILPIGGKEGEELFLSTELSVKSVQERLKLLYLQIALAVGWGVVLHLVVAVYVYRVIFQRIGILKNTSTMMAEGDLSARAEWKQKSNDELDDLGSTFNFMAHKIEENMETVTRLNRQIQNELEIGKEVQELFLPKKKVFEDYDMTVFYRPLREVSGDIYKFYRYSNNARGLFFADASGHGVSAALITTITIMSLDVVVRREFSADRILSQLNNLLAARLESSFFCTGVFLIFDTKGQVTMTNAGHNPPLYLPAGTDEIEELEKDGPPMGMMEDIDYGVRTIQTRPGDRLFIYSDGLVESKNSKGEMFGLQKVKDRLMARRNEPTKPIVDDLYAELDEHTAEYMDDVSIIYLEMP